MVEKSIYTRTRIYRDGTNARSEIIGPREKITTNDVGERAVKMKPPPQVVVHVFDSNNRRVGEGDVRAAAWVLSHPPYTKNNALLNDFTDETGAVRMNCSLPLNTEILIRARAMRNGVFVGNVADTVYKFVGDDDSIKLQLT